MAIPLIPIYGGDIPDRNAQDAATFTFNSITWLDYQVVQIPATNTSINGINVAAAQVAADEESAAISAAAADSSANFKGRWLDLTGPLNIPASVERKSRIYQLLENLADVTLEDPLTSSKWIVIDVAGAGNIIPFNTLADTLSSESLFEGAATNIKDRTPGNGGGAFWDAFPAGTFAVGATIFDVFDHDTLALQLKLRPNDFIELATFGFIADGVTDNNAAFQAAIDVGNARFLGGSLGGGGVELILPEGKSVYTGVIWKSGVSMRGVGQNASILLLSGVAATGIKNLSATSGLAADQLQRGHFRDFSMFSDESAPTSQIQWNIIGFSRWETSNVFIQFFGGCNGISMKGSVLTGSGGPAQFYNDFYNCFLLRAASNPAGGIALDLGDTDSGFEQVTTFHFHGGRVSGSGDGTGLALRGTGCAFFGVVYEGLDTAVQIGSSGTRGANTNSFFGCYWEGNTTNRQTFANASGTKFSGSFVTGGVDADIATDTTFDDPGVFESFAGSSGAQKWEVKINNGGVRRPKFTGSTLPAIEIENSALTSFSMANGAATSAGDKHVRFLDDALATSLLDFGTVNATFKAVNIKLREDTGFGIFTGSGSPEGVVVANVGSVFQRTDGGASTSHYIKESGTGNTGWVAK